MYCLMYGVDCGVISFQDKGTEQFPLCEMVCFHLPRRFMPHQDVPKHVYVIARQPGAVESMPDDSPLVRYESSSLAIFSTLNEWVLRTCWVYIQHFPRDLQDAFRDAGRLAGTHGDCGTQGTDFLRSWVLLHSPRWSRPCAWRCSSKPHMTTSLEAMLPSPTQRTLVSPPLAVSRAKCLALP